MVNSISLKGFTSFTDNSFSFTNGINILIGKNGTGKTHVLKSLASAMQARHEFQAKQTTSKEQFEYVLAENMGHYFKPDSIGNLVNKNIISGKSTVGIEIDGKELSFSFSTTSKTTVKIEKDDKWDDYQFIYIPPREMFSLFEGFIGLSSKRELSFDQTYINLAPLACSSNLTGSGKQSVKVCHRVAGKGTGIQGTSDERPFLYRDQQQTNGGTSCC